MNRPLEDVKDDLRSKIDRAQREETLSTSRSAVLSQQEQVLSTLGAAIRRQVHLADLSRHNPDVASLDAAADIADQIVDLYRALEGQLGRAHSHLTLLLNVDATEAGKA